MTHVREQLSSFYKSKQNCVKDAANIKQNSKPEIKVTGSSEVIPERQSTSYHLVGGEISNRKMSLEGGFIHDELVKAN